MGARKPPIQIVRWSANRTTGRSAPVTLAALHESVGMLDALALAGFCEEANVSYHAIADRDKIVYTVPRPDTAWHLRNGNKSSDGICLTSPTRAYTRDEWLGPEVNKVAYAAWWLALVCPERGIDLRHCSYAQIRAALRGDRAAGGVCTHDDYTQATGDGTHDDPRNFPTDICVQWAIDSLADPSKTMPQEADEPMIGNYPISGTGQMVLLCPTGSASADGRRCWLSASVLDGAGWIRVYAQGDSGGRHDWLWDASVLRVSPTNLVPRPWTELLDGVTKLVINWDLTGCKGGGVLCLEATPRK